jgi:hypothetical protein
MTSMITKIPVFTTRMCCFTIVYYAICIFIGFMIVDEYVLIFKTYYYFEVSYSPVYEIIYFSQVILFMTNNFLIINVNVIFSSALISPCTHDHKSNGYISGGRYMAHNPSCNPCHLFFYTFLECRIIANFSFSIIANI